MNTKHILHLVTFVLTFAVSVTVAGAVKSFVGLSTAEKITQILTQDIANGDSRRAKNCRNANYNKAFKTEQYVSASESISVSGLPQDFQAAWQAHMQAWRSHADFLNENKYSSDFDTDFNQISRDQINEINRTWYEVLRIARTHRATIPYNAYN